MNNLEQTLSIIKPDAVERNLSEEIKSEFEKSGFNILKEKKLNSKKVMRKNFMKYTKLNHFITIYVIIVHQVL